MKRPLRLTLFYISLFLTFAGCKKDQPLLVTFDVDQGFDFSIPPNTLLDWITITTPGLTTNWNADFDNHNTDKDKIQSAKLKSLSLTIKNPAGKTWKFLKSIEVYIKADGLSETKIAYIDNISQNVGQTLNLIPVDVDLAPYAKKDSFSLRINTKPQEYNTDTVDASGLATFTIKANVRK